MKMFSFAIRSRHGICANMSSRSLTSRGIRLSRQKSRPVEPRSLKLRPCQQAIHRETTVSPRVYPPSVPTLQGKQHLESNWNKMTIREMAPYLALHEGTTMVIHIPGRLSSSRDMLDSFLSDVALMHTLGIRLVLVAGSDTQINCRLSKIKKYAPLDNVTGMRVTDAETLNIALDAAQEARVAIESRLHRGIATRGVRLTANKSSNGKLNRCLGMCVISGNLVTARPAGIIGGIDYQHAGVVRSVKTKQINDFLDNGNLVLLTNICHSVAGKTYKCSSEEVASYVRFHS